MGIKLYDVTVGSGIIGIFAHKKYKVERVISEFVDNSLQSYVDNKEQLLRMPSGEKCKVDIYWEEEKITIVDNAYGMNEDEYGRSLKLKSSNPKANKSDRLSVFGMGLKYAAVCLGSKYKIISTRYSEEIKRTCKIDVSEFEKNNPETVDVLEETATLTSHGTTIEITELRNKKTDDLLNKLRESLGNIYQFYISNGDLVITVNGIVVKHEEPLIREDSITGEKYIRTIEGVLEISNSSYRYKGWVGILETGKQAITGLKLFQANRCIQLDYKPTEIFQKGNSFQNSRMVGEIRFEGNQNIVSYDKDQFIWPDNTEEIFINKLMSNPEFSYIIQMCKKLRKDVSNEERMKKLANQNKDLEITNNNVKTHIICGDDTKKNENIQPEFADLQNKIQSTVNIKVNPEEKDKRIRTKITDKDGNEKLLFVDTYEGDVDEKWLNLTYSQIDSSYILKINVSNGKIHKLFKNDNGITNASQIAIKLVTAMLKMECRGAKLNNSIAILNCLNEVL